MTNTHLRNKFACEIISAFSWKKKCKQNLSVRGRFQGQFESKSYRVEPTVQMSPLLFKTRALILQAPFL